MGKASLPVGATTVDSSMLVLVVQAACHVHAHYTLSRTEYLSCIRMDLGDFQNANAGLGTQVKYLTI